MKIRAEVFHYVLDDKPEIDAHIVETNNVYDVIPWIANKICEVFYIEPEEKYYKLTTEVVDDTHLNVYAKECSVIVEDIRNQIVNVVKDIFNNKMEGMPEYVQMRGKFRFQLIMHAHLNEGGRVSVDTVYGQINDPHISIFIEN